MVLFCRYQLKGPLQVLSGQITFLWQAVCALETPESCSLAVCATCAALLSIHIGLVNFRYSSKELVKILLKQCCGTCLLVAAALSIKRVSSGLKGCRLREGMHSQEVSRQPLACHLAWHLHQVLFSCHLAAQKASTRNKLRALKHLLHVQREYKYVT